MLKKRSRAATSKQSLMSDYSSLPSHTAKFNRPTTSSMFPSPRLFVGFSAKGFTDSEAVMSPTSILETKPFSASGSPIFADRITRKPMPNLSLSSSESKYHPWGNINSGPVGLGIVDALKNEENSAKSSKPESRMVLFGSQLKIQIPPVMAPSVNSTASVKSPHFPIEFGMKNRNPQLGSNSPAMRSPVVSANCGFQALASPQVLAGSLSPREMELSEDYNCIISRGPNPRTTHIFDNHIVESCCDNFSMSVKESKFSADRPSHASENFLSSCYSCKKDLGKGKDIYIYRGEKAFCSRECRHQEMMFDDGIDKCSPNEL